METMSAGLSTPYLVISRHLSQEREAMGLQAVVHILQARFDIVGACKRDLVPERPYKTNTEALMSLSAMAQGRGAVP